MDAPRFLQDLAVVLGVASAVLLLFRRLGWPPVLGYLAAGLIVGPHTPPHILVSDPRSLEALAEVGVVFLLFALGAEFNLRRLSRLGLRPLFCAAVEASVMIAVGVALAGALGWGVSDGLVLGGAVALASTAIVARTLLSRAAAPEGWEELAAGVLIAEDLIAVFLIALVASPAGAGGALPRFGDSILRFVLLSAAVAAAAALVLPRLLAVAEKSGIEEAPTLAVVGVCFGLATLTHHLGFSPALGAFIAGAAASLGGRAGRLHEIAAPFRDVFGAVFFVSVGMLIDPRWLYENWGVALAAALAVTAARFGANILAFGLAGVSPAHATGASIALMPIGEFSFLLAMAAQGSGRVERPVHALVVAACLSTTVAAAVALPSSAGAARLIPGWLGRAWGFYSGALERLAARDRALLWTLVSPSLFQMALNGAACLGIHRYLPVGSWLLKTMLCLPFLSALVRKAQAVALILLEAMLSGPSSFLERYPRAGRAAPMLASALVFGGYLAATRSGLPGGIAALGVLALAGVIAAVLWRPLVRAHAWAQFSLREIFSAEDEPEEAERALDAFARSLEPARLRLLTLTLAAGDWAARRRLGEVDLRSRTGAAVLQLSRGGTPLPSPGAESRIEPGDTVLLIAEPERLAAAEKLLRLGPDA